MFRLQIRTLTRNIYLEENIMSLRKRISGKLDSIRYKITSHPITTGIYDSKSFFEIGIGQIAFISGKFPEIMAYVFFAEKAGYKFEFNEIIGLTIFAIFALTVFGYFWKRLGFYDAERKAQLERDPIMLEVVTNLRELRKDLKELKANVKKLKD